MNEKTDAKTVSQRAVLYFAGFDPRGASTYHAITTGQFERHCDTNGLKASCGKRERLSKACHRWFLESSSRNKGNTTELQFLVWDDLVRAHWIKPDWRALLNGARAFFRLARFGVISHMLKSSKPVALTACGPLLQVMMFVLVAASILLSLVAMLNGWIAVGLVGFVVSILAFLSVSRLLKAFNAPWISRITSFAVAASDEPILENWTNREVMARHLLTAVKDDANNEILLIAHSVGTQIGLLALADAIELDPEVIASAVVQRRLCFITLGQTVPLMSRISAPVTEALKIVGESAVPWLDISAPSDPACYAMVDPYRNQFGNAPRVHIENARFFQAFRPDTYRKAQADRFTMHFLYLMTPDAEAKMDRETGFDLYGLMTSHSLLSDRLSGRPGDVKPFYQRAMSQ